MLFESPIFGPVHSRRLGVSLGINLLPADGKVCSFDCIYCECGYNGGQAPREKFPTREAVRNALRQRLADMQANGPAPDVLTFAGNGEPTLHPEFAGVIDDTIALRNEFFPEAKVSVLSNAAQILRQDVFDALLRVDNNILKLDTVSMDYIRRADRPQQSFYDVEQIIARMTEFQGHCIVQTLFMHGTHKGEDVSNLDERYVAPWLEAVQRIAPSEVMVYTIDRQTPSPLLRKALPAELDAIAEQVRRLGIPCQVSY